ncbi:MAG TPA: pseudouridine-5'-phosphate glycosidase [Candidatus Limnocylindrales bacterium]|nr:pseudouridine-5'-phosphate glycosidase [Candidatus Limnocylindrales bacterium]
MTTSLDLSDDVRAALKAGRPVVALESAVLTHGLPLASAAEAVLRQRRACVNGGALPAVVAVFQGRLRVGLSDRECVELAGHAGAAKVSPWNLAGALLEPGFGGLTVAATVRAASLSGIPVVATGGLGGVHPGQGWDVSADLDELAHRKVCVVCSGPKSILDVEATVERLETLGIPLIGWRSDQVGGFLAETAPVSVAVRVETIATLTQVVRSHWALAGSGVVISRPLEGGKAIPPAAMARALEAIGAEGAHSGAARTPADLDRVRTRLGQAATEANLALLEANAGLAAALASALAAP